MRSASPAHGILAGIIAILALADAVLHAALNYVLFGGNFFGPLAPPPGAPAGAAMPNPLLIPLNLLFSLNAIGYVVLVLIFWFGPRWLGGWSWLVDAVLIIYSAAAIIGWVYIGLPNPMGLGYISKAIEIALIIALAWHARGIVSRRA